MFGDPRQLSLKKIKEFKDWLEDCINRIEDVNRYQEGQKVSVYFKHSDFEFPIYRGIVLKVIKPYKYLSKNELIEFLIPNRDCKTFSKRSKPCPHTRIVLQTGFTHPMVIIANPLSWKIVVTGPTK